MAYHDPLTIVTQLRQALAADKLSIGFFLGAGCPCAVLVPIENGKNKNGKAKEAIIPDIKGLTAELSLALTACPKNGTAFKKLVGIFQQDKKPDATVEAMLNLIRSLREVAGETTPIRDMSVVELDSLDRAICVAIRDRMRRDLPNDETAYHALANFVRRHRYPATHIFTTNYDLLMEQALEAHRVPYFDGFVGSWRPFFDQRAVEDDKFPERWSRLWKLHGSINWRLNKKTRAIFRCESDASADELLIHPSHLKYDESRRMPYFIMIDRLTKFLRNSDKPVALIVIGYSFGDEHLNEAIVESLKINPLAACFALQFGNLADYREGARLAADNSNLSLLANDKGIIRREEGGWLMRASTDSLSLRPMFEVRDGAGSPIDMSDEADRPKPCSFLGGNFEHFGKFLNEFAPNGG